MSQLDTIDTINSQNSDKSSSMESNSNNHSLDSLEFNGTNSQPSIDMEMITKDCTSSSSSYTSLKELLIMSPSAEEGRKNSWREIDQLKDPIVQRAARAYLQPLALEENDNNEDKRFIGKLKDKVCGVFGCFNDVVLRMIKGWFVNGDHQIVDDKKEKEEDLIDCLD
ncbi:hypothetical protein LIER_29458 [Lithospermum erythrorhizon]|uniref:Uncharacterized protein n=1 Tax=Lithospermum erythrorhizon TaxID=34254 RepID=A0AAV3RMA5_LITER